MIKDEIYQAMTTAVTDLRVQDARPLAHKALAEGLNPAESLEIGFVRGLKMTEDSFRRSEISLGQLLRAAKVVYGGLEVLLPEIPIEALQKSKRLEMSLSEEELNAIGKSIVETMVHTRGYTETN